MDKDLLKSIKDNRIHKAIELRQLITPLYTKKHSTHVQNNIAHPVKNTYSLIVVVSNPDHASNLSITAIILSADSRKYI